jgi:uncharacterized protein DUF6788
MKIEPRGIKASNVRKRKYDLIRKYSLPEDLLPGSLSQAYRKCGKANCHCAEGEGHPIWLLTYSFKGNKRVERIPDEWVDEVRERVDSGRAFRDAVKEVLAANAELLALCRTQKKI